MQRNMVLFFFNSIKNLCFVLFLSLAMFQSKANASSKDIMMNITANVVGSACTIRQDDENISIQLDDIDKSSLVQSGRISGEMFQIYLEGCDVSISDGVRITFSGNAIGVNNELLALDGSSTAKGFAIGFEQDGKLLPINKPSSEISLNSGTNILNFNTYIQMLPSGETELRAGSF
ncbi:TPA: fimbrial protein, partial [Vibrio cholerae]